MNSRYEYTDLGGVNTDHENMQCGGVEGGGGGEGEGGGASSK